MTITEAIEKAGPESEGRCGNSSWTFEISQSGGLLFRTHGVIQSQIPVSILSDNQWEVVEDTPVIEAGDVVKDEDGMLWTVHAPDQGFMLLSKQHFTRKAPSKLTLIRKGPKVIEVGDVVYMGNVPHSEKHEGEVISLSDDTARIRVSVLDTRYTGNLKLIRKGPKVIKVGIDFMPNGWHIITSGHKSPHVISIAHGKYDAVLTPMEDTDVQ